MQPKRLLLSTGGGLVLVTLLLIASLFGTWEPLQRPERLLYDRLLRLRPHQPPGRVVIVAIDDASIQQLGVWPWPRATIAEGLGRLSAYGAEAVALTPLFPTPAANPALDDLGQLRETLQEGNRQLGAKLLEIEKQLEQDRPLIQAVRAGRNMVLPFRLQFDDRRGGDPAPLSGLLCINSLPRRPEQGPALSAAAGLSARLQPFLPPVASKTPAPRGVTETFRALAGKAAALGAVDLSPDPDGVVRQARLLWPYQDRYLPSLALQLALKSLGQPFRQIELHTADRPPYGLRAKATAIPTDIDYRMRISFQSPPIRLNQIPFADLLADKVDPDSLRDQVAIVGVTSPHLTATHRTPLGTRATGTEIMAAAVDTILRGDYLVRPAWAPLAESTVLIYFLFFLLLVIPRVRLRVGAVILAVFLVTSWGGAVAAFLKTGFWFRLLPPLVLCVLGFGAIAIRQTSRRLRAENVALNRSLGLSFQTQGLLDMALEKFMQCPAEDKAIRRLLYNLGLDFERKRMPEKARVVYDHILRAGGYRDAKRRAGKLTSLPDPAPGAAAPDGPGGTLKLGDAATRPTFGRYEILQELGQGAMGTVYLGLDPKINRQVAIKTLGYGSVPPEELEEARTRFLREAEAAGKLSHPNIVTIYDIGEEHDTAYMAMELLEGHALTEYCRSGRLKPLAEVLDIMAAVTQALGYAHKTGVIHRDIKPANIMQIKDGRVKVTDFGIAKVRDSAKTRTGIVMGTPSYMSPEQVGGKKLDGRSDLFSLGIVFYEMLTGRKPFGGENLTALMYAIAKAPYRPIVEIVPDIPSDCVAIVDKLLNKGVTRRYKTAEQALEAIRRCRRAIR